LPSPPFPARFFSNNRPKQFWQVARCLCFPRHGSCSSRGHSLPLDIETISLFLILIPLSRLEFLFPSRSPSGRIGISERSCLHKFHRQSSQSSKILQISPLPFSSRPSSPTSSMLMTGWRQSHVCSSRYPFLPQTRLAHCHGKEASPQRSPSLFPFFERLLRPPVYVSPTTCFS